MREGATGDVESGRGHPRWVLDVEGDRLIFTPKMGWAHPFDHAGETRRPLFYNRRNIYVGIFWEGSFDFLERFPKGPAIEAENLFLLYDTYFDRATDPILEIHDGPDRGRAFEWITEFLLPIERKVSAAAVVEKWEKRRRGQPVPPYKA